MVRLPPPVWTLIFLALAGAASALLPIPRAHEAWLLPVGAVLAAAGLALSVWAALLFRREGTEINPTSAANRKLVTSGPYRFTRNPMYLSLVLISLGIAFIAGALPMFAVPVLVFLTAEFVHIPFEEAKMARQFGDAFAAYRRRVRRWF